MEVDGKTLGEGDHLEVGVSRCEASFLGRRLRIGLQTPPVVALHKPAGFVTSRRGEGQHLSVFDLLRDHPDYTTLLAIGRLDAMTTGLLLFTVDGTLVHRLTHPRRAVPRTYVAHLVHPADPDALEGLARAEVTLRDGHTPTPSDVRVADDDPCRVTITLHEGKYHEVRRAFAAIGAPVVSLHRVGYGPVRLADADTRAHAPHAREPALPLDPGAWISVSAESHPALWHALWDGAGLPMPAPELRIEVLDA